MNGEVKRKTNIFEGKSLPVSLYPTQILHGLPSNTVLSPLGRLSYSTVSTSSKILQRHRLGFFLLLSLLWTSPFSYGALMFVTLFTTVHQGSYTFSENAHSFQPFCFALILKLYLRPILPSCLFPSGFLTKSLCPSITPPIHATCTVHFIHINLICLIIYSAYPSGRAV